MRHEFEPARYHRTLGSHPEVLRIASGDTVVTTCVDAEGRDRHDRQVTEPGNPMTGPFHVEGAEPGDVLAVRFDRIEPNREIAWSATGIAPHVLDPVPARGTVAAGGEPELAEWRVRGRTATLLSPQTGLGPIAIPTAPMLGCFGVAPPDHQAISTATAGPYGGNMDYAGFRAGVTVHLPVFVDGALLFLGDGHALQGEGEIAGSGLEISMEVEFSVDLRKAAAIAWPRGDTGAHIFTVGCGRPLDQALQHATTEMCRWLTTDHGLDPQAAQILMGQCVEYDVANMFDPAYAVVCKLAREVLETALEGRAR
jgi:amidase